MSTSTEQSIGRASIWFGAIGAFLAIINGIVATLALGVAQGPVVGFTTPFAFCLGKLMFRRLPAATAIFTPLVLASMFNLNLGPPGPYKILFVIGPILYDLVCLILRVGSEPAGQKVSLWKLIVAQTFYPIGLLAGAFLIVSWFTVDLPLLEKGWKLAPIFIAVFAVIGAFSTFVCHRVYYRWIAAEVSGVGEVDDD